MATAATLLMLFLGLYGMTASVAGRQIFSADKLKETDIASRRELLFKIVGKLNQRILEQVTKIKECNVKINDTIDECNTCRQNMCPQSQSFGEGILQLLSTGANAPLVYAADALEETAKWFSGAAFFFGDRGKEFANILAGTATSIGDAFDQTGGQLFSDMGGAFEQLGDDLTDIGNTLEKNPLDALKFFVKIGDVTADLETLFSNSLSNAENVIGSALDKVKNFFGDLFGRKRRSIGFGRKRKLIGLLRDVIERECETSCPVCDKLDKTKYSVEEILKNVCGAEAVASQTEAISDIKWLQSQRNYTIDNTIITKVEYETGAGKYYLDFDTGTIMAKEAYYTTDDGVERLYGSDLNVGNNAAAGKQLAVDYFPILWNSKT